MKQAVPIDVQLRSLMASSLIFGRIIKTCKYASEAKLEEPVKTTTKAGIVVSYMMPFRDGAGFRKLGEKYTHFAARDDLRKLHLHLEESRNCVYAHYGPANARRLLEHPSVMREFDTINIEIKTAPISPDGKIELRVFYTVNNVNLLDVNFPKVIELCQYHKDHVEREINAIVKPIWETGGFPDGNYILGKDFPASKNPGQPE